MKISKPLVLIPARGGSKGIPGKNSKLLSGKPLINYTVEVARQLFADDLICISTDDLIIKSLVEATGLKVPFLRPEALSTDVVGTQEVLLHALEYYAQKGYEAETIILLQPTSPFRTSKHLSEALEMYSPDLEMLVSVVESKSNPYFNLKEENAEGFLENSKTSTVKRRQDCPPVYEYNGAIYIINVEALKSKQISDFNNVKKYVMNQIDSIDLDEPLDWEIAELVIRKKGLL